MKSIMSGLCLMLAAALGAEASEVAQNVRVVWSENPQTEAVVVWDSITPKAINYTPVLNTGEVVDSATFKPRR